MHKHGEKKFTINYLIEKSIILISVILIVIISVKVLGPDNFFEEYVESHIKKITNYNIDLTPDSDETSM